VARLSEQLAPGQHAYLVEHGTPPDAVLTALADETERISGDRAEMRIAPEQGALLTLLARLVGARLIVEVGTFTGYSSICLARGLEPGGRLVSCEIDENWAAVARQWWAHAGVADRCECRVGNARATLRDLPPDPIDLAFVDADKDGYVDYWEHLVPRMRPRGLLVVDNVLFHGQAARPDATGAGAAIRRFNAHAARDPRVERVMLPVADGLTLARVTG
jgi:caffeoyl-CoA O-methyltransferase